MPAQNELHGRAQPSQSRKTLHVDVFADVICPWCWIGERRLRRALAERDDIAVSAAWKPFQLDPRTPDEGVSMASFIERKLGGYAHVREMWDVIENAGASEDITFRFDLITRFPNSRRAHELVLYAATEGRTWVTVEALYSANFAEGLDVSDFDTLIEIATRAELDTDAAREALNDFRFAQRVLNSQREAADLGITGVPLFVLNDQYGIAGAQPVEVFRRGIAQAVDNP